MMKLNGQKRDRFRKIMTHFCNLRQKVGEIDPWGWFHQGFTSSFLVQRSQKRFWNLHSKKLLFQHGWNSPQPSISSTFYPCVFVQNLAPKITRLCKALSYEILASKMRFHTKNVCVKCWWNLHLVDEEISKSIGGTLLIFESNSHLWTTRSWDCVRF
jgi:hypothetical protein